MPVFVIPDKNMLQTYFCYFHSSQLHSPFIFAHLTLCFSRNFTKTLSYIIVFTTCSDHYIFCFSHNQTLYLYIVIMYTPHRNLYLSVIHMFPNTCTFCVTTFTRDFCRRFPIQVKVHIPDYMVNSRVNHFSQQYK